MFIWLNLGCWHDCESRLCCESTLHKHRKGNIWSPNTTKSIFKGFLEVHLIDSPDLFFIYKTKFTVSQVSTTARYWVAGCLLLKESLLISRM